MKLESTPDKYNSWLGHRYTISGKIKNGNDFAVEKLIIGIDFFDRNGKKIDQHNEELTNAFYENSESNFEEKFDLSKVAPDSGFTYSYKLVDAKKR